MIINNYLIQVIIFKMIKCFDLLIHFLEIKNEFDLTKKNRFIHKDLNYFLYYQFKILIVIKILTVIIA